MLSEQVEVLADVTHDLLHARAQSIGAIDISVEVNDQHVDGEVLFGEGPDMGFTFEAITGSCRFCELIPPESERWLVEHDIVLDLQDAEAAALTLLRTLLDARRDLRR